MHKGSEKLRLNSPIWGLLKLKIRGMATFTNRQANICCFQFVVKVPNGASLVEICDS